jgi:predicted nuclease of predicted toxin-antitoxin system
MRFLVDENLPLDVVLALRELGHDVLSVSESEHKGATDRVLWQLAADQGRVLVTRDLDFPLVDMPAPPGLILVRAPNSLGRSRLGEMIAAFAKGDGLTNVEGSITVVSPGRVRTRTL